MLIPCPECRKQISENAATCPGCGVAITPAVVMQAKATADKKNCAFLAWVLVLLAVAGFVCHNASVAPAPVAPASTAEKVATLDGHEFDKEYIAAVDELLTRLATKCNSAPSSVAGKALAIQKLVKEKQVTMHLREILESIDLAVPRRVSGTDIDHIFAEYATLRQDHTNVEAISTLRAAVAFVQ